VRNRTGRPRNCTVAMVVVSSLTVRTVTLPAVAGPALKSVPHAAPPNRRVPRAGRPVAGRSAVRHRMMSGLAQAVVDPAATPLRTTTGGASEKSTGGCLSCHAALRSSMCLCQRQKTWSRMAATGLFITPSALAASAAMRPCPMLCRPA